MRYLSLTSCLIFSRNITINLSFAYIHQESLFELNFEFFLLGDNVGETVFAYVAVVLS